MNKTANPALPIAVLALAALAFGAVDDAQLTTAVPAGAAVVAAATASPPATATATATATPTATPAAAAAAAATATAAAVATATATPDRPIAALRPADAASTAPEVYVVDNPRLAASLRVRKPQGLTAVRWLDSNQY
ncbi:MAG: hypothetical protein LH480_01790 [Rubrivivax sp.]|nr:hypothetical protein [Rubrivivax sp.]